MKSYGLQAAQRQLLREGGPVLDDGVSLVGHLLLKLLQLLDLLTDLELGLRQGCDPGEDNLLLLRHDGPRGMRCLAVLRENKNKRRCTAWNPPTEALRCRAGARLVPLVSTCTAVVAVCNSLCSSHRQRATMRAMSMGFSRYLLCRCCLILRRLCW
ncbi:hypothetical protein EYF80_048134 [Liparis tanakae]|uniref:Uncharacterized protein n=1 Tax=Liparis tanakae TaxID=230148 RepID=A0A4Z2FLB9_9TELE|nr:hypothetical protein EYF80_048134 [Liparis tanakae]